MKAFTPFIIIAICVGAYFMYIGPTYSDVQTLSSQKGRYEQVLQKAQELVGQRDSILAEYNSVLPDDINRLKEIVPEKINSMDEAIYINNIASQDGLVMKDFKASESQTESQGQQMVASSQKSYEVTALSFTVSGPYEQFVNFLKDIEASLSLFDVTNISIKTDQKNTGQLSFEYNISLNAYSLSQTQNKNTANTANAFLAGSFASASTTQAEPGQDILDLSYKLKTISIDSKLFTSDLFKNLKDFYKPLMSESQGRPNPFASIGNDSGILNISSTASTTKSKIQKSAAGASVF